MEKEYKNKRFKIIEGDLQGHVIDIDDWWKSIEGESWVLDEGNPITKYYILRIGGHNQGWHIPIDDKVLYGTIGGIGYLVHESELGDEI